MYVVPVNKYLDGVEHDVGKWTIWEILVTVGDWSNTLIRLSVVKGEGIRHRSNTGPQT